MKGEYKLKVDKQPAYPMKYADIYVHKPEEVPQKEHYAIITGTSYHTEAVGQWAPGHGYSAEDHNVIEYAVYFDKQEFLDELQRRMAQEEHRTVIGIHVNEVFTKKVTVEAVKV